MGTMGTVFAGIDVGKDKLDIHLLDGEHGTGQAVSLARERDGLQSLSERLQRERPAGIVLEASGGYESPVARQLLADGLPAAVVNPKRVRSFAEGLGQLAKTDRLDARVLARFARDAEPRSTRLMSEDERAVADLRKRRQQIADDIGRERNRRHSADTQAVLDHIDATIDRLEAEKEALDAEIRARLNALEETADTRDLLQSAPGVGPTVAATLMLELPELGQLTGNQIAALVGVAPYSRDSGRKSGKRTTRDGRAEVRRMLYLATQAAKRSDPNMRARYERLCAKGKPPMVAIVACMNTMIRRLNAMVAKGQPWVTH
jgi:transposase